jgi:hypothetical protein
MKNLLIPNKISRQWETAGRTVLIVACLKGRCPRKKHSFFIFCPNFANEYDYRERAGNFARAGKLLHVFFFAKINAFQKTAMTDDKK